jgi:hypothetical protein
MALTFGGLGLAFFGEDKGLNKSLDSVTKGVDKVWGGLKNLADNVGKMGAKIGKSIAGIGRGARDMASKMGGVFDSLMSKALSPSIDNSFSSMYAQFNKTFGALTVGMDISSKEAGKWRGVISSTAHALNEDMAEAAKSWAAFRKHGIRLDKLFGARGMAGSMKALIKLTSLFGISGEELASTVSGLTKGFGFTETSVKSLMDRMFVMGKHFNMGKEAIKGMPGILESVNNELADWKKGATATDVENFMLMIVKTAGGVKEALGGSSEKALEFSKSIFQKLMASRRNFTKMMIGMGGEIGDLGQKLWQAGGDPKVLRELISANMPKFMEFLHKLGKTAKKTGEDSGASYGQLRQTLRETFGPDMVYLMEGNWGKAMESFKGLNEKLGKSQGALGSAMKKSFKSGRTAGEAYNLMLENQKARMHGLTNRYLPEFMKSSKQGFDMAYQKVKGLSEEKGPTGELTRRLLAVQRFGIGGLMVGMKGVSKETQLLGTSMSGALQNMLPMISALGSMGINFGLIGKLLSPGGLILGGLLLFNDSIRAKVFEGVKKTFEYVQKNAPKWIPKVRQALIDMWGMAIKAVKWGMEIATPMMLKLADAISKVDWGGLAKKVIGFIGKFFRGVGNAVFGGVAETAESTTTEGKFVSAGVKLVSAIGRGMMQAGRVVLDEIKSFFWDWSGGLENAMREKGKMIGSVFLVAMMFGKTRNLIIKNLAIILAKMSWFAIKMAAQWVIAMGPVAWVIAGLAAVGAAIGFAVKSATDDLKKETGIELADPFTMAMDVMRDYAIKTWEDIKTGWSEAKGFFQGIGERISGSAKEWWGKVKMGAGMVMDFMVGKSRSSTESIKKDNVEMGTVVTGNYTTVGAVGAQNFDAVKTHSAVASGDASMRWSSFSPLFGEVANSVSGSGATMANNLIQSSTTSASESKTEWAGAGSSMGSSMIDVGREGGKSFRYTAKQSGLAAKKMLMNHAIIAKALKQGNQMIANAMAQLDKNIKDQSSQSIVLKKRMLDIRGLSVDEQRKIMDGFMKFREKLRTTLMRMGFKGRDIETQAMPRFQEAFAKYKAQGMEAQQALLAAYKQTIGYMPRVPIRSITRMWAQHAMGGIESPSQRRRIRRELAKKLRVMMSSGKFAGKEVFARTMGPEQIFGLLTQLGYYKTGAAAEQRRKTAARGVGFKRVIPTAIKPGAPAPGAVPPGLTEEQKERLVRVKERLAPEDRQAFADIGYQIKTLASAIDNLANRPIQINITGRLKEFFNAVQNQSRQSGSRVLQGMAGRG